MSKRQSSSIAICLFYLSLILLGIQQIGDPGFKSADAHGFVYKYFSILAGTLDVLGLAWQYRLRATEQEEGPR